RRGPVPRGSATVDGRGPTAARTGRLSGGAGRGRDRPAHRARDARRRRVRGAVGRVPRSGPPARRARPDRRAAADGDRRPDDRGHAPGAAGRGRPLGRRGATAHVRPAAQRRPGRRSEAPGTTCPDHRPDRGPAGAATARLCASRPQRVRPRDVPVNERGSRPRTRSRGPWRGPRRRRRLTRRRRRRCPATPGEPQPTPREHSQPPATELSPSSAPDDRTGRSAASSTDTDQRSFVPAFCRSSTHQSGGEEQYTMFARARSMSFAGGGGLALALTLAGVVAGATVLTAVVSPPTQPAAPVADTTATFEDLDGNGVDDQCQTDVVVVADPVAAAAAEAAVDLNGDGTISVSEAAQSDRT